MSVPHGIIPISAISGPDSFVPLPLKEAEYLCLQHVYFQYSFEFLFTHDHMKLMVYDYDRPQVLTALHRALPLFSALRVLVVEHANPSFLAGHTFHKLERCRVVYSREYYSTSPSLFTETEMPICTRVDVDDPYLLATFKLPQIYELALDFSPPDSSTIWKEHIAVNVNLSGLNFLHMKYWLRDEDLISILRSLPLLETLILSDRYGLISFRSFLPMDAYGTSELNQTSGEGQALALLCPRLESLQIEVQDPSVKPELIPILKDIVTLRAECGSPLKEFTFSDFRSKPGSRFELIGRNGSFTMEKFILLEEAEDFKLDMWVV
jgi:hypothetical protein